MSLFSGDLEQTAAFHRLIGLHLKDEDHGDGQRHLAADLGGVHFVLAGHQVRPWACRAVAEDPDGRAVEINQRGHLRNQ